MRWRIDSLLRADIGIYRHRRPVGIYCGLVSGYTAQLAAFGKEASLDRIGLIGEYCAGFCHFRRSPCGEIYSRTSGRILSSSAGCAALIRNVKGELDDVS